MDGEGCGMVFTGGVETLAHGTVLCKHCQKVIITGKGFDERSGYCRLCDNFICVECVGKDCKPWEKKMEELERAIKRDAERKAVLRSYGVL